MKTVSKKQPLVKNNTVQNKEYLTLLADTASIIATATLWPCSNLSSGEIKTIVRKITWHIKSVPDHYLGYTRFCRRILLAKEALKKAKKNLHINNPLRWISATSKGLAATDKLLNEENGLLKLYPNHNSKYRVLPEAVLDMREQFTRAGMMYWTKWFNQRGSNDELMLFYTCIAIIACNIPDINTKINEV